MNVENVVPMAPPVDPPEKVGPPHASVLLRETIDALAPAPGRRFIDATLGAGGHSEALLEAGASVIGVDRDPVALGLASQRLARFGDRFVAIHGRFAEIAAHLAGLGAAPIHGIVADLGVSSMQLDEADRGMSFRKDGPLDMRMDPTSGATALDLIDALSDDELADVIYRFGDERRSRRVARCIKQARAAGDLHTTLDLRRAVVRAVGPARVGGVDPATRTFQGLRIAVNDELGELTALLAAAEGALDEGGRFAVISFHSLEDRLVKRAFRAGPWRPLTKKPRVPTDVEANENPRARSAKLRVAERLSENALDPSDSGAAFDDEETEA